MQGDWRAFVKAAKIDFEAGLQVLKGAPESRLLVDWAVAYGSQLIEGLRLAGEAVEATASADATHAHFDDPTPLYEHERARHAEALAFLRGVGRD